MASAYNPRDTCLSRCMKRWIEFDFDWTDGAKVGIFFWLAAIIIVGVVAGTSHGNKAFILWNHVFPYVCILPLLIGFVCGAACVGFWGLYYIAIGFWSMMTSVSKVPMFCFVLLCDLADDIYYWMTSRMPKPAEAKSDKSFETKSDKSFETKSDLSAV